VAAAMNVMDLTLSVLNTDSPDKSSRYLPENLMGTQAEFLIILTPVSTILFILD
jgi:hypothetical protein